MAVKKAKGKRHNGKGKAPPPERGAKPPSENVVLHLQVDDSEEPLKELRRVVEKWNATRRPPR